MAIIQENEALKWQEITTRNIALRPVALLFLIFVIWSGTKQVVANIPHLET